MTKRALTNQGTEYIEADIYSNLDFVTDKLGYMAAPVVAVYEDDGDEPTAHWAGFDPERIKTLV